MTEQEWLAQSDDEKERWIGKNIFSINEFDYCSGCESDGCDYCKYHQPYPYRNYLNWHGFGLIIDKCFDDIRLVFFKNGVRLYVAKEPIHQREEYICVKAPTPWEAAALCYGKLKGLIK